MPTIDPDTWAYHRDFSDILVTKDSMVARRLLTTADIALCFARRLVAKNYDEALEMLSSDLKSRYSPELFHENMESMIYCNGDDVEWPTGIQVITAADSSDMKDWKEPNPADFGWVYVGIHGDDYNEAVAVMITNVEQKLLITRIDWGRP